MSDDDIKLTETEVDFLMIKLAEKDPEMAIDQFIELLVLEGADPMKMKAYVDKLFKKGLC